MIDRFYIVKETGKWLQHSEGNAVLYSDHADEMRELYRYFKAYFQHAEDSGCMAATMLQKYAHYEDGVIK